MNILAIDPGNSCTGLAWETDEETGLTSVRPKSRDFRGRADEILHDVECMWFDVFIIEIPQVYQRGKSKGDPNDLIRLALLVGVLEGICGCDRIIEVLPAAWKGQVPKDVHHKRLKKLIPKDAKYYGAVTHDTLDAFGLLLYAKDLLAAEAVAKEQRNRK